MTRHTLNKFVRSVFAVLLGITATTYGAVPAMEVTVSDPAGKVAFKGTTTAAGTFATGNLQPGSYVVQFKAKSQAAKENQYLVVVSAGKKKVVAEAVPGEKFIAGGVAMKIDARAGMQLTGQTVASNGTANIRVINGKRHVWVAAETGSNLRGKWVEEGSAGAQNVRNMSLDQLRKMQDLANEGSMIPYSHHHHRDYGE